MPAVKFYKSLYKYADGDDLGKCGQLMADDIIDQFIKFEKNELFMVRVDVSNEDWLYARCLSYSDRIGFIPSNHVELLKCDYLDLFNFVSGRLRITLFEFSSNYETCLSFDEGELLHETGHHNENWGYGTIFKHETMKKFPYNYTALISLDRFKSEFEAPLNELSSRVNDSRNQESTNVKCRINLDFDAVMDNEMSVKHGDIVSIVKKLDEHFVMATVYPHNDITGRLPTFILDPYEGELSDMSTQKSSSESEDILYPYERRNSNQRENSVGYNYSYHAENTFKNVSTENLQEYHTLQSSPNYMQTNLDYNNYNNRDHVDTFSPLNVSLSSDSSRYLSIKQGRFSSSSDLTDDYGRDSDETTQQSYNKENANIKRPSVCNESLKPITLSSSRVIDLPSRPSVSIIRRKSKRIAPDVPIRPNLNRTPEKNKRGVRTLSKSKDVHISSPVLKSTTYEGDVIKNFSQMTLKSKMNSLRKYDIKPIPNIPRPKVYHRKNVISGNDIYAQVKKDRNVKINSRKEVKNYNILEKPVSSASHYRISNILDQDDVIKADENEPNSKLLFGDDSFENNWTRFSGRENEGFDSMDIFSDSDKSASLTCKDVKAITNFENHIDKTVLNIDFTPLKPSNVLNKHDIERERLECNTLKPLIPSTVNNSNNLKKPDKGTNLFDIFSTAQNQSKSGDKNNNINPSDCIFDIFDTNKNTLLPFEKSKIPMSDYFENKETVKSTSLIDPTFMDELLSISKSTLVNKPKNIIVEKESSSICKKASKPTNFIPLLVPQNNQVFDTNFSRMSIVEPSSRLNEHMHTSTDSTLNKVDKIELLPLEPTKYTFNNKNQYNAINIIQPLAVKTKVNINDSPLKADFTNFESNEILNLQDNQDVSFNQSFSNKKDFKKTKSSLKYIIKEIHDSEFSFFTFTVKFIKIIQEKIEFINQEIPLIMKSLKDICKCSHFILTSFGNFNYEEFVSSSQMYFPIDEIFSQNFDLIKSSYEFYVTHYERVQKNIVQCLNSKGDEIFKSIVDAIKSQNIGYNIESVIMRPFQRITKYPLFFKSMLSELKNDDKYGNYQDLYNSYVNILQDINQSHKIVDSFKRISRHNKSYKKQNVELSRKALAKFDSNPHDVWTEQFTELCKLIKYVESFKNCTIFQIESLGNLSISTLNIWLDFKHISVNDRLDHRHIKLVTTVYNMANKEVDFLKTGVVKEILEPLEKLKKLICNAKGYMLKRQDLVTKINANPNNEEYLESFNVVHNVLCSEWPILYSKSPKIAYHLLHRYIEIIKLFMQRCNCYLEQSLKLCDLCDDPSSISTQYHKTYLVNMHPVTKLLQDIHLTNFFVNSLVAVIQISKTKKYRMCLVYSFDKKIFGWMHIENLSNIIEIDVKDTVFSIFDINTNTPKHAYEIEIGDTLDILKSKGETPLSPLIVYKNEKQHEIPRITIYKLSFLNIKKMVFI
ncbi:hypothetical protein A3Q56_05323 [Intoshia linei]|uniref:Uncharacterized protein n=1 Tax=Intoshia linei TaxID=1819745 RepID=A0A177AY73_9BILA|nr:hypothetical protein A3Q56_05323 [Intoshia linei]